MTCATGSVGQELATGELPWARQPASWATAKVYPPTAERQHTPGRATIRCRASADGELAGCKVQDERPAGAGFGRAALFLSDAFRLEMGPKGSALKGRAVDATIDFVPPGFARIVPADPAAEPFALPLVVRWRDGSPGMSYPFKARFTGLSARVVLRCKIGAEGVLTECLAIDESPKGFGLAANAEDILKGTRVSKKTVDGRDSEGLTIETVVVQNPSCDEKPAWDRRLDGCLPGFQPFHPNGEYH